MLSVPGAARKRLRVRVHLPLFVVCCLLFVVCCLLSVVCCLLFVVCCLLFVVCCLLSVVCCLLLVVCFRFLLMIVERLVSRVGGQGAACRGVRLVLRKRLPGLRFRDYGLGFMVKGAAG